MATQLPPSHQLPGNRHGPVTGRQQAAGSRQQAAAPLPGAACLAHSALRHVGTSPPTWCKAGLVAASKGGHLFVCGDEGCDRQHVADSPI
jgi:hypothetical protein